MIKELLAYMDDTAVPAQGETWAQVAALTSIKVGYYKSRILLLSKASKQSS